MRIEHLGREASVECAAVRPQLAHRSEHGDAPLDVALGAEALQRRGHRSGIGIVALVDQQHLAAADREHDGAARGP